MPRSSRHKTQRSCKHGDGELEGDASSRDLRVKREEKDSAARVSAKSSSSKDLVSMSNEGEKKRKDRGEGRSGFGSGYVEGGSRGEEQSAEPSNHHQPPAAKKKRYHRHTTHQIQELEAVSGPP